MAYEMYITLTCKNIKKQCEKNRWKVIDKKCMWLSIKKKGYINCCRMRKMFASMTMTAIVTSEKLTRLLFHDVAEGILLDSKRVKSILPSNC